MMAQLVAGYRRFRKEVYPQQKPRLSVMASHQTPHTLFITCSDLCVAPETLTQSEPGELSICSAAGNLIPAHGAGAEGVVSAVEYAVMVLGVEQIVLCGHSDCEAMRAFLHPEKFEDLPALKSWVEHASTAIARTKQLYGHLPEGEFVERLIKENIVSQLQNLRTHPAVAVGLRNGSLRIHGWHYDIAEGAVTTYEEDRREFVPLDQSFDVIPEEPPSLPLHERR
jgi:carbonic anhydrase